MGKKKVTKLKEVTKKENKALTVQQSTPPSELLRMAISNGTDLDKLEKALKLQMVWEANEAKKVYNSSMVAVHHNIPTIGKSLRNAQTNSKYADLGNIIRQTKEIYTGQGFSISFYEGDTKLEGHIRICADVIHRAGHKETYHYDMPLDGKGIKGNANMTPIHGKGSSTSYARRYLMCMIFNIPTGDDDDGQAAGGTIECINDKQLNTIRDFVDNNEGFEKRLLTYLKVDKLENIQKKDYSKAILSMEQAQ